MELSRLTAGAGGGVGEMVASRGQREEGVLAQGATHVELLQEIGLSENLQCQADEWVAWLEDSQQHMQQIAGALASVAQDGSMVDLGGSTMSTWLEDKCRQLSTILWQIVEDPELEPFVDWQRAKTLIMNCNMIYSEGVDYYDQLKERLLNETSTMARATMKSATATINTTAPTPQLASAAVSEMSLPIETPTTAIAATTAVNTTTMSPLLASAAVSAMSLPLPMKTSSQITAVRVADVTIHKIVGYDNNNNNKNNKSNDVMVRAIGYPLPPPPSPALPPCLFVFFRG
ncbi:hypothetical protein CBR_g34913 [Chara braunii]|uniref:Uncharacterized protein n=1 Tax=Chara braunii TaxID=69332 RepID=A0A388LJU3_CHABU|nr:hypothetical protein CBR_g34913 [Chara braunii]|eukprot:GBG82537.1 hypothetical protein CBR_g34913 [Chara braunii]